MTLAPQFPRVAARSGHYESIYLTASHPTEPVAVWIRYTVHKTPGGTPTGSIWFTLFAPGGPTAVKVTEPDPVSAGERLIAVGELGHVRTDGATGAISGNGVDASWDLHFEPVDRELRHLPGDWMYRAPVPRTKSTSPYPSMRVRGTVRVAGRALTLDGWAGMLGHNWGSEHAHRWIWLRGASFADHPDAWLDVVIGRIKIGPAVTPWIANGAISLDGVRNRVGGLGHRATVRERRGACDLILPGHEVTLTVQVSAPLAMCVGWEYADPSGGRHQVRNCSTAAVTVDVRPRGQAPYHDAALPWFTAHGGVYELGTAEFDPEISVQPYPDG